MTSEYKQTNIEMQNTAQSTRQIVDGFLYNFRGKNKVQRGNAWDLKGSSTSFLSSVASVSSSVVPTVNNSFTLGTASYKWSDIQSVKINGTTPKSGSATYYVASTSGGAVTTAVTFTTGILT